MADQMINALPTKTEPVTGDKVLLSGASEEYLIDYDKLATAILNKLTSKTFTLDQGTKTLVAALNELNSKTSVYATPKQDFLNLGTKLKVGISYPLYLSATAMQEITNATYTITGKGIVYVGAGSQMDILCMIGAGDVILTGRIYADQDPLLYRIKTEKIV